MSKGPAKYLLIKLPVIALRSLVMCLDNNTANWIFWLTYEP